MMVRTLQADSGLVAGCVACHHIVNIVAQVHISSHTNSAMSWSLAGSCYMSLFACLFRVKSFHKIYYQVVSLFCFHGKYVRVDII